MSDIGRQGRRHRPPAWLYFTLGGLLAPSSFIALILAVDRVGNGGGLDYLPSILLAGFAGALIVLGFHRLPEKGGVPGRSAAVLLLVAGLTVVAGVTGVISGVDPDTGELRFAPWLIVALILSGMVGTVWVWRAMNAAAREGQKFASHWGAAVGTALATPLFLFEAESDRLRTALGLADDFQQGALSLLLLQFVGYAVAWSLWRVRRR